MKLEIAHQADEIRRNLDELDKLIDDLNPAKAHNLSEVYKSLNVILKAQKVLLEDKPDLRLV